jgi:hypothetical protein
VAFAAAVLAAVLAAMALCPLRQLGGLVPLIAVALRGRSREVKRRQKRDPDLATNAPVAACNQ